ncbi:efflux RND transporter periplasmic adaptor subunit [Clostridium beijerinckii]|jgi:multidrug efflux pump subunit AcrA (membrane-fusion protein)|uniref:Efflux RND transporter periplasmic adaptor subunit n=2 Tax=Clostridium beijerinckii TaxID=1520 RepID=A0AAE2UZ21_CLOBE|nr:efflux RND transporter periplasmic adaptor subunit [Clostridium beijerinckii]ABR35072.1 efflux transporter, RND family, MFP subunit [Clostridium beijerinckii NCIMB 8052]AIU04268.1 RND family efflux transporter MFP subunit [Clostridium beijerinckii ATCC 35702]MBF7810295.1 efflux RND transporter periplasmic adaptor subunit [Clostridium beijerinckii]NOW90942.1 multidrug efflux pump subunit AcrA (membrane-fusion protein) [Clostridium beijerinckii]NRT23543.1 multidrug efflux pump subunit AcrA (m
MKKILVTCLILINLITLSGCSENNSKADIKIYPVKTVELKDERYPVSLEYEGLTGGSEVRKLSFKSSAKVSKIYISKGQHVQKGDKLVDLDKTDLNFAMEGSKSQMDAASAQYNKAVNGAQAEDINKAQISVKNAQDNYNYCKDLYDKNVSLFEMHAVTQQQVNDIKIKLDGSESELNGAKETLKQLQNGTREEDKQAALAQLNAAKADYESKFNLLQDASLTADVDGYVVDILCKEGEMQSAGYPAVLIRSENQVVTVGLSDEDVKKIQLGIKAQVKIDDITTDAEVMNIVQMADSKSGTYSAEIKLLNPIDNSKFYIGQSTKVYINEGEMNGIWIPISTILNDGQDYVYVVEDGRAVRKNITLGQTNESQVCVEGLKSGDNLVNEGMKNIKAGYQVSVN